jgi:hypothetical protein
MAINAQGSFIDHTPNGSPEAWRELEECKNIDGPSASSGQTETTHLRSTSKEYLPQLPDNGEVTLTCNFTAQPEQLALRTMFTGQADAQRFRIHIPTDSTKTSFHIFAFNASVTKWQTSEAVDNAVPLNITLKVTGDVVFTAGT